MEGALGPAEVRRPDVASVNHSGNERDVGEVHARIGEGSELNRRGMQGFDACLGQRGNCLARVAIGGRHEQTGAFVNGGELLPCAECRGDEVAAAHRKVVGR